MDHLRQAVVSGDLAVGDPLPSVRSLAKRLRVNHNTVAKAYSELVRDGVIESRHGHGVFVSKPRQMFTKAERNRRLRNAVDTFLGEILGLGMDEDEVLDAVRQKFQSLTSKSQS